MLYKRKSVSRTVFKAYDMRGIVGTELDEDAFYSIARAMSCRLVSLNRNQIYLGRDARPSSDSLAAALQQGFLDSGISVVNLGAIPTPLMYYAVSTTPIDCGVVVTGSHNASEYNGIKIVFEGRTLVQTDMDLLFELVTAGTVIDGKGTVKNKNISEDYIHRIAQEIHLKHSLKVVVDAGNGIAGPMIIRLLKQLGCEVIPLYCEIDGNFPNHHPDPTIESNLTDLKAAVIQHHASVGFAFDGDADRLGVVTNTGKMIYPDRIMMLYASDILKKNPGGVIVYDVKCSSHLTKVITALGGIPKMCPTGHSIVKSVIRKEHAIFAGEMSGHLFFKDRWYGFDDALYSACRLLEILDATTNTIDELFQTIPESVSTPEIKIDYSEAEKFNFMRRFAEIASFPGANIITIDGLRVEFEKGWGLLRASNTSPFLIARFEAMDEENLAAIQRLFKEQIKRVDPNITFPF